MKLTGCVADPVFFRIGTNVTCSSYPFYKENKCEGLTNSDAVSATLVCFAGFLLPEYYDANLQSQLLLKEEKQASPLQFAINVLKNA